MKTLVERWRGASWADRAKWGLFEGLGLGLLLFALRATWALWTEQPGMYDEGILLTNAHLLLAGKVPYRDFYSNYPPGVFLVLAGLFKVFGASIAVERAFGLATHVALALFSGRLAGRLLGTPFSFVAAGLVATWLAWLGMTAFAWLVALAAALLAVEACAWAAQKDTRLSLGAAGFAVGAVSWFRHDLFAYWAVVTVALAAALGLYAWRVRKDVTWLPRVLAFGAGVGVALVVFWPVVFARGGFMQTLNDLYFDQVRYVLPARKLPLPNWQSAAVHLAGAIAVTLVGPFLALASALLPKIFRAQSKLTLALLGTLAVAVIPQMMGRTDEHHALYTVTPAVTLGAALALGALGWGRLRALAWICAVGGLGLLFGPVRGHLTPKPPEHFTPAYPDWPRASTVEDPEAGARKQVVALVQQLTQPGEPIYVGSLDHQTVFVNEMDLYFLADRPGSTRYLQFDPNVVNRDDVQRTMIAELERAPTRVAILSARFNHAGEPNDSSKPGATLLNEYFQAKFQLALQVGPYWVLTRR